MKRFILLSFSLLLLTSFNLNEPSVAFFGGSFEELQAKAKAANKPYLLYFYTVWCGPCKNMEKYTFPNKELANYMKDNAFAFKSDAESIMGDGIELAQKYDARFYPTLLIMSPTGEVLKKLNGYQTAEVLLEEIKKARKAAGNPKAEKPKPEAKPSVAATPLPVTAAGEGLFKVSVSKQEEPGFGVQLGVFADYANVIKESEKLANNHHRNVLVAIQKTGEKTVFKLILGPFSSKEQAESYAKELQNKDGRNGMVVDLGKTISPVQKPESAGEGRGASVSPKGK